MSSQDRGWNTLPHTADVIIEAWAGDGAACAEEAAAGLLGICVSQTAGETRDGQVLRVPPGSFQSMVEAVLEHLIYLFDTSDLVPVAVSVEASTDGGLELRTTVAPPDSVQLTGAAPKGIVRLSVDARGTVHRCRFIVDV